MPTPRRASVAVLVALFCARPALAEPPAGAYTIDVASPEIFVPAELAPTCFPFGFVEFCIDGFTAPLVVLGSGELESDAYAHVEGDVEGEECVLDGEGVPLPSPQCLAGETPGSLSGSTRRPKALLEPSFSGPVSFGGIPLTALVDGRLRCRADSALATMLCRGSITLCAFEPSGRRRVIGCEREKVGLSLPLEGGGWQLRLVGLATDDEGVVTGTAEVELATGLIASYVAIGQYDDRKDRTTLRLVGTTDSVGSTLKLTGLELSSGGAASGRIVFRIAGQAGKVKLGAAP